MMHVPWMLHLNERRHGCEPHAPMCQLVGTPLPRGEHFRHDCSVALVKAVLACLPTAPWREHVQACMHPLAFQAFCKRDRFFYRMRPVDSTAQNAVQCNCLYVCPASGDRRGEPSASGDIGTARVRFGACWQAERQGKAGCSGCV